MSWITETAREGRTFKTRLLPNPFPFKKEWIIIGAEKSMDDFAKNAGEFMAPLDDRDKQGMTNSQIRNVFGEIKRIQMKGFDDQGSKSSFYLLKAKVAYAHGRQKTKGMDLFKKIFDLGWDLVDTDQKYKNFCDLLEAILAYHKAFGGN